MPHDPHEDISGEDRQGDSAGHDGDSLPLPTTSSRRVHGWLPPTLASGAVFLGFATPSDGGPPGSGGFPTGGAAIALGLLAFLTALYQRVQAIRDKSVEKEVGKLRGELSSERITGGAERDVLKERITGLSERVARAEDGATAKDAELARLNRRLDDVYDHYLVATGHMQRSSDFEIDMAALSAPAGTSPRVLVVEDDRTANDGLSRLLVLYGYRPISAFTLAEALAKLDHAPQVVLLDLMLPDADRSNGGGMEEGGRAFLQHVRDRQIRVPVIVTTAMQMDAIASVTALNPEGILIKPFQPREPFATIREILGESRDGGPKSG